MNKYRRETVILPLPTTIQEIRLAADRFLHQYGCQPRIDIRGSILLENGEPCPIPQWHRIVRFDSELEIVGLGEKEDDIELLWVSPATGELRITSEEEEKEHD
jgi:hypothetical protein